MIRFILLAACCGFSLFLTAQIPSLYQPSAGKQLNELAETTIAVDLIKPVGDLDLSIPLRLPVAADLAYDIRFEARATDHAVAGVNVYHGYSGDPRYAHLPHYRDVILVTNPAANTLRLLAMTHDGVFSLEKAGKGYELARATYAGNPDTDAPPAFSRRADELKNAVAAPCAETNAAGKHVVDVLFTYSIEAATLMGDIVTHAVSQAESVNLGLANSLVENMEIRVVDIAVGDNLTGVHSPALGANLDFYATEMQQVAADVIADYQGYAEGANNNFGGWASTGGRSSINYILGPTIFRHEFGHNLGSSHCTPGIRPYAAGYNNGIDEEKTLMCGNQAQFYSNPDISLTGGPIGVDGSADNARLAREVAVRKANYQRHVVPYFSGDDGVCGVPIADGYYFIQNVATGAFLSPASNGSSGQKLFQRAVADGLEEVWEVHNLGSGKTMIHNANTGRVMDVFGNSGSEGNNVGLWSFGGGSNQTQVIAPTDAGNYTIQMVNNGYHLRPAAGTDGDGAEVGQYSLAGSDVDEWVFVPVSGELLPLTPLVSLVGSNTAATCVGGATGSATVTASGGNGSYTYAWEDGQTTATATGLTSGEYRATVTSGGRDYLHIGHVMTKAPLIISGTADPAVPGTKGTITIDEVLNANGSLSYAWSDGGSGATRTGLDAGDYTVTATDADGCTDVRIFRVGRAIDYEQNYLIQDVATGLYVAPAVPNPWWANAEPMVLGNCPTAEYAFNFDFHSAFAGTVTIANLNTDGSGGATMNAAANGDIVNWFLQGNRSQYFYWSFDDVTTDDLIRLYVPDGYLTATGTNSALSLQAEGDGPQTFRLVPIPDCATAGDVCSDGNNSTDGDVINLLCDCCGEQTACFGIEGAAANGDGDVDGDGVCVDVDCNDNDPSLYIGALCDDGDGTNFGDAYADDCLCYGRAETCTETGDALEVVSTEGTATSFDALASSPSPSVLTDGIIDGAWNGGNGNVWHSGGWYSYADVDLNTVQSIRELRIHPRTDPDLGRLANVFVFISSVPFPGASVADARSVADYEYQIPNSYSGTASVVLQPNLTGRYVRLKAQDSHLNLTEIEVRSCPLQTALPVTLTSFTGRALDKKNVLSWEVATEEAFDRYVVERSASGTGGWTELGAVAGAGRGPRSYAFDDLVPPASAYYRLRMIDLDGSYTHSSVLHLLRPSTPSSFTVAPVPSGDVVRILGTEGGPTEFSAFDLTGRRMGAYRFASNATTITVDVSGWPAGVYLLRGDDGTSRRLVVHR